MTQLNEDTEPHQFLFDRFSQKLAGHRANSLQGSRRINCYGSRRRVRCVVSRVTRWISAGFPVICDTNPHSTKPVGPHCWGGVLRSCWLPSFATLYLAKDGTDSTYWR